MANTSRLHIHLNPNLLLPARYIQLLLAILFLILLCYASANRGWWVDITAALALGIITGAVTLVGGSYSAYTLHKRSSTELFAGESLRKVLLALVPDLLLLLMWAGTAALLIKPKGKDWRKPFSTPPYTSWVVCIVLGIVELVLFVCTAVLGYKHLRGRDS